MNQTTEFQAPMLPSEYASHGGASCPVCRSQEIISGIPQMDGPHAWAEIECEFCKSTWNDYYQLTGYSDLETN